MTDNNQQPKVLKRQPGLSKFNRLTKSTSEVISQMGHSANRFKRDYAGLKATYQCANCGAVAIIQVATTKGVHSLIQGGAISERCEQKQTQE